MISTPGRTTSMIGVLLIMALATAFVLFNLNRIVANNKDYFLSRAGESLGRTLVADKIQLSISSSIALRLVEFAISDDRAFSAGDFVRADELAVELKLLPLLKRSAEIKRLALKRPEILIIRDAAGAFNFSSLADNRGQLGRNRESAGQTTVSEGTTAAFGLVSLLEIEGGSLRFIDTRERIDLPLEKIDFKVEEYRTDAPFNVEFSAALLADRPNLKLRALVGPIANIFELADVPLDLRITIDRLDTAKLRAAVPTIRSYLPEFFDFSGTLSVADMRVAGTMRDLGWRPRASRKPKRGIPQASTAKPPVRPSPDREP